MEHYIIVKTQIAMYHTDELIILKSARKISIQKSNDFKLKHCPSVREKGQIIEGNCSFLLLLIFR